MKMLKERYADTEQKKATATTGKLSNTAAEVSSCTEPPIFRTLAKPISYPLHSSSSGAWNRTSLMSTNETNQLLQTPFFGKFSAFRDEIWGNSTGIGLHFSTRNGGDGGALLDSIEGDAIAIAIHLTRSEVRSRNGTGRG